MAQPGLDQTQVGAGFQKMRCPWMALMPSSELCRVLRSQWTRIHIISAYYIISVFIKTRHNFYCFLTRINRNP
jgi:hypothetical protein